MKAIISGGGTGGHIFPAIAIADALKKEDPNTEILFVGAQGRMEMERVPKAGYPIKGLWISGFQRSLTFQNLLFPVKLITSLWNAVAILRHFKPDVVVGVGGYASGPTLRAANWLRIPTVLQEQNSYAGVTNKLLAQKAKLICVAYDKMDRFFPANKIRLTGNPVRQDLSGIDHREEAFQWAGFDSHKSAVMILGGSLGARTLNRAMEANTGLIASNPDIQFLWQCGRLYFDTFQQCDTAKLPNVKITPFIDRMDLVYALSDVVISRAGALSISEICLTGKAAVLVPSPNVAEDHQTKNALSLVEKDAAILVKDKDAEKDMIPAALQILRNPSKKTGLEKNVKKLALPNAAKDIALAIQGLIR